jgi:hypothetical protein
MTPKIEERFASLENCQAFQPTETDLEGALNKFKLEIR